MYYRKSIVNKKNYFLVIIFIIYLNCSAKRNLYSFPQIIRLKFDLLLLFLTFFYFNQNNVELMARFYLFYLRSIKNIY